MKEKRREKKKKKRKGKKLKYGHCFICPKYFCDINKHPAVSSQKYTHTEVVSFLKDFFFSRKGGQLAYLFYFIHLFFIY